MAASLTCLNLLMSDDRLPTHAWMEQALHCRKESGNKNELCCEQDVARWHDMEKEKIQGVHAAEVAELKEQ